MTDPTHLLANDPRALFPSARALYSAPQQEVEVLQLAALRYRFGALVERLPMLRRHAEKAGVAGVESLQAASSLLYPAAVYKSYQSRVLEERDYAALTRWLQNLTTHDLGAVDASHVASLDEWFALLEATTPLRICHSSSTSGKLSFVPRGVAEWERRSRTMSYASEPVGTDPGPDTVDLGGLAIISPYYRSGHSAFVMNVDWNIRVFGDADRVATLHDRHLSSDLVVLAGQLRTAAAGAPLPADPSAFGLPASIADRWEEVRELAGSPTRDVMASFVASAAERFSGERVWVIGTWPTLIDASVAASAQGFVGVYDARSVVHTGGGTKGRSLPAEGFGELTRWLGVPGVIDSYGMSEVMGLNVRCAHDRYHLNPWTIPYVVTVDDGMPLPREGRQRGRFGAIDLLAESYWGGFLSDDVVTLTWDDPCECGRLGPYLDTVIERMQVADEKVSCAATPALLDDLVTTLQRLEVGR